MITKNQCDRVVQKAGKNNVAIIYSVKDKDGKSLEVTQLREHLGQSDIDIRLRRAQQEQALWSGDAAKAEVARRKAAADAEVALMSQVQTAMDQVISEPINP